MGKKGNQAPLEPGTTNCTRCRIEGAAARLDMAVDALAECVSVVQMWQFGEARIRLSEAGLWFGEVMAFARKKSKHTCR